MWKRQYRNILNFGILGAVIFKNYEIRDLSEDINTFDRIESGLDWGFSSDPATYIRCHFDRKKQELYILDEIYGAGWTNQEFAEKIKAKYTGEIITADSSEKKSVEELRQEGLNIRAAKKGPGSVETGYKYLQSLKVIINSKCTNTIKEFMSHKWKEDRHGTVLPVPEDKNNHAIDAIRYMLEDKIITSTGIHFL